MRIAPNRLVAGEDLLAQLEPPLFEDRAELFDRRPVLEPRQIFERIDRMPFERRRAVRDGDALVVHDGRVEHRVRLGLVGHRRFQQRPQAAILLQRAVRIGRPAADHANRLLQHGVLSCAARDAVSSMRTRVSDAICTAVIPATTSTTSVVTPATCLAFIDTEWLQAPDSRLRAPGSRLQAPRLPGKAPCSPEPEARTRSLRSTALPASCDSACCAAS